MAELSVVLNLLVMILVTLGGYVLMATRKAVETGAEEIAKAAIEERQWRRKLARDLQKIRGVERQELRFKSYGALWKRLRPLAIYDETVIDRKTVGALFANLSDWYFSECGGLFLTPQSRGFYFALQDLLRTASRVPGEWSVTRSDKPEGAHGRTLRRALEATGSNEAIGALDYLSEGKFENWQEEAIALGEKWRKGIRHLAAAWDELDEEQRFASLQQVGSKLRTSLVTDLESRLP
jgi:hypothetical protein